MSQQSWDQTIMTTKLSTFKTCTSCGENKPEEHFHWHYKNKGIRRASCKTCRNKEELSRQMTPDAVAKRKEYMLNKNYGITKQEYDEQLKKQNYGCSLCGSKATFRALAVDHCHTTGKVREILCSPCNQGLGLFKDNPELLEKAAEYLRKHSG